MSRSHQTAVLPQTTGAARLEQVPPPFPKSNDLHYDKHAWQVRHSPTLSQAQGKLCYGYSKVLP